MKNARMRRLIAALLLALASTAGGTAQARPNVVLILGDDDTHITTARTSGRSGPLPRGEAVDLLMLSDDELQDYVRELQPRRPGCARP
jgi:hypothetical protein